MTGKLLATLLLGGATGSALAAGFALDDGGGFLLTAAILALLSGHLATGHLAVAERTGRKRKTTKGKGLAVTNLVVGYVFLLCWLATTLLSINNDEPPTVAITNPGKMVRKPAFYDLMIKLNATDDHGLKTAKLVASRNGGEEKVIEVPVDSEAKEQELSCVLPLGEMKLSVGDVVSYYVVVDDGSQKGQTESFQVDIVDESEIAMSDVPDSEVNKVATGGERATLGAVGLGADGDATKGGLNEDLQNALNQDQVINDKRAGAANGIADVTNAAAKPVEEQDESGTSFVGDNKDEDSGALVPEREGDQQVNEDVASAGYVTSRKRDKYSLDKILFENPVDPEEVIPRARDNDVRHTLAKLNSLGVSVPKSMSGRCDKLGRGNRLTEGGGNLKVEAAVIRGLNWLKRTQNKDGSWGTTSKGAMTGFALLCFLGHCELTDSADYGKTVANGIKWLIRRGNAQNGWLSFRKDKASAYSHGIATYGLAEGYGMTEDKAILPVLAKAVAHIVNGQKEDGGWFYAKNQALVFERNKAQGSDTSVSGWQYQALKAAHNCGHDFPGVKEALTESVKNFYRVYSPQNGGFGYQNRASGRQGRHKLTGVGVIGLQGWKFGHVGDDPRYPGGTLEAGDRNAIIQKGCEHILRNNTQLKYDSSETILYGWYYETQAMFNRGGAYWQKWNDQLRPELLAAQQDDGSWKEEGSGNSQKRAHADAEVYRSTLCLLMLEVYYRYVY